MYNTIMDTANKRTRATLSSQEVKELKKLILGYGRLKEVADKTGLNKNTVRSIAAYGSGLAENVEKIRDLLSPVNVEQ